MEMLVVVLLPFAVMASAIVLVSLVTVLLVAAFWRMIFGSAE
jgi:hypothetical protein